MNKENIFTILERNNLSCDGFNYGLLGCYSETIKSWVKEIYGVDLNEIEK
ncbi:hypothetical protein [Alkaliphilus sp. B6464]|nr:hypothetical protein [Alkaliphilus sp. B6464]QUH21446.1 hypothetical protein HYG84_17190 [Alkaliphilus sp. B6464]